MKIVNYTHARSNLRCVIDDVVNDSVPCCVVSKNNQVVIMSKSDYDNLIEARYVQQQLKSGGE